jgi:hypothetical protein
MHLKTDKETKMDFWNDSVELDICEIHDNLDECTDECITDFSDLEDELDIEDERWLPYLNGQKI